jgi:hypothetical protein
MHFMSVEVAAREFLFIPERQTDYYDEHLQGIPMKQANEAPFLHNHLHDLESLWWVAVWVVFYHRFSEPTTPGDHPSLTLQDAEGQLNLAKRLFPSVLKDFDRRDGFKITRTFQNIYRRLPPNKQNTYRDLNFIRQQLISHYQAIEAKYPLVDPNDSTDDIYNDFTRAFSILKSKHHDVVIKPIVKIQRELLNAQRMRLQSQPTATAEVAQETAEN